MQTAFHTLSTSSVGCVLALLVLMVSLFPSDCLLTCVGYRVMELCQIPFCFSVPSTPQEVFVLAISATFQLTSHLPSSFDIEALLYEDMDIMRAAISLALTFLMVER